MEDTCSSVPVKEEEEIGNSFYEEIEAPKFVDFTALNHYNPDDRYWFCSRVGCDQKHEEELDSEAIYKNFVLRVMAARSPNVKLQKALKRKETSADLKCPLTAPPKSSKSRVSRLALISSVSKKFVDNKVKAKPLTKVSATPNGKIKQSSALEARSFTTPRNRKHLLDQEKFRSVQNPKAPRIAVPKNTVVAKALVFHSPKKVVKIKTSMELRSSMKTLCSAMKKLDINGGKKKATGHYKALTIAASKKQLKGREVKSRVYDSSHSQSRKVKEASDLKGLKEKNKAKGFTEHQCPLPREANDTSDMEIEEKSRVGSLEKPILSGNSENGKENGQVMSKGIAGADTADVSSDNLGGDMNMEEKPRDGEGNDQELSQNIVGVDSADVSTDNSGGDNSSTSSSDHTDASKTHEEKAKPTSRKQRIHEHRRPGEITENDEKENTSEYLGNRDLNLNSGQSKSTVLSKIETSRKTQKSCASAATGSQVVKHRKPKPTNPKPFRFRTDERGILKEATLERKLVAPLKDITPDPVLEMAKAPRKHQNVTQKNENCFRQSEKDKDISNGFEERSERRPQDQPGRTQGSLSTTNPRRKGAFKHQKPIHLTKQQDKHQNRATQKLSRPLGVIEETSAKVFKPRDQARPTHSRGIWFATNPRGT